MFKKLTSIALSLFMILSLNLSTVVFASVTPSDWAATEIEQSTQAGLITEKVTVDYQKDITREEFCELVVKLYEKLSNKTATTGDSSFADTNNPEILKANNLGIVYGVGDGLFAPANKISRQEIAVMMVRAIKVALPEVTGEAKTAYAFADQENIANWALSEIKFAYSKSILNGVGDNKIDPLGNATCEQAIALVYRTYTNKAKIVSNEETPTNIEESTTNTPTVFEPKDVTDETIKSIRTYNDYLVMYQAIQLDYYSNYEAVLNGYWADYESIVKGTILWNADTFAQLKSSQQQAFQQLKDASESAYEQQKDSYKSLGDQELIGKDTFVEFLIGLRDYLKDYTDNLNVSLQEQIETYRDTLSMF